MGDEDKRISYLYEPEGSELHWDGLKAAQKPGAQQVSASLSGPVPKYSDRAIGSTVQEIHPADRVGMSGTSAAHAGGYGSPPPQAQRQLTPAELDKMARDMVDNQAAQTQAQLSQGPSTGARDAAGGKIPEWLSGYMDKEP